MSSQFNESHVAYTKGEPEMITEAIMKANLARVRIWAKSRAVKLFVTDPM